MEAARSGSPTKPTAASVSYPEFDQGSLTLSRHGGACTELGNAMRQPSLLMHKV